MINQTFNILTIRLFVVVVHTLLLSACGLHHQKPTIKRMHIMVIYKRWRIEMFQKVTNTLHMSSIRDYHKLGESASNSWFSSPRASRWSDSTRLASLRNLSLPRVSHTGFRTSQLAASTRPDSPQVLLQSWWREDGLVNKAFLTKHFNAKHCRGKNANNDN